MDWQKAKLIMVLAICAVALVLGVIDRLGFSMTHALYLFLGLSALWVIGSVAYNILFVDGRESDAE